MEITTDVTLKGSNWRKALDLFAPFFPQSLQPNYSIFAISISIGIMYDKQLDIAGEETPEEKDNRPSVPRTVLHPHNTELDFLSKYANFGVEKLLEHGSDEPIEAMQKIKSFLASMVEGYNYEIDSISEDDLSEEDLI